MKDTARTKAQQLVHEFMQRGDVTGWFEPLYAGADGDAQAIPWADMAANPSLVDWMERHSPHGEGRKALVIGCGLRDDAEELASRGFEAVAFDIAPTAINWCHQRFPASQVQYVVADACDLPASWQGTFDFVLEAYTLQVLPPEQRERANSQIASAVSLGGTLLVICRGRSPEESQGNMPWPLTRRELDLFQSYGLQQAQFEDYLDHEEPPTRRFRVQYVR